MSRLTEEAEWTEQAKWCKGGWVIMFLLISPYITMPHFYVLFNNRIFGLLLVLFSNYFISLPLLRFAIIQGQLKQGTVIVSLSRSITVIYADFAV
ncbi:putative transmembrane protein [Gregarina niphandrodes]|uniref:Transmembrane protein n=1 Tax=Gregarina niphandrodes TaxID=110365 RepID=A0A023B2M4_GRENI|nr:putative transmembrane protein [Gregarina niphandrodes]EZG50649.1 putative transmembrane protein [Gregarina niphandrodes]|eukprot:XP_011131994.1 putative transmembrane protein [Gregarina niphandrodes]